MHEVIAEILISIKSIKIDKLTDKLKDQDRIQEECNQLLFEVRLFSTMKVKKSMKYMSITSILKWQPMMLLTISGIAVLLITGSFQEKMPQDKIMEDTKDTDSFSSKPSKDK